MLQHPNIDPVIISLGPLAISWYSLAYVLGILLGIFYLKKIITNRADDLSNNIKKIDFDNFITWIIVSVIIGGRMGHVLFYDASFYMNNPIEILKTYKGGMSFHGGLIGYCICCYLFARKNNIEFLELLDISAAAAPIGIFFGRCANFINSELYGKVTDVYWGVVFPYSDYLPRHPTQIYEALLEGVLLFTIIFILIHKYYKLRLVGYISGVFGIVYGVSRIFVELFKELDNDIGYIMHYFTMGQLLSLPLIIFGIILIYNSRGRR